LNEQSEDEIKDRHNKEHEIKENFDKEIENKNPILNLYKKQLLFNKKMRLI